MIVTGCGKLRIIRGTREEVNEWEENHPEYISRGTFNPEKIIHGIRMNSSFEDLYKRTGEKVRCIREAAMIMDGYNTKLSSY